MFTKENFVCNRCGKCCHQIVDLSEEDIALICSLGIPQENFVATAPFNSHAKRIKQIDGKCFFLSFDKDNMSFCKIYDARPKICKDYPFFRKKKISDCKPDARLIN
jgi:Fe-S-cluster containining protein